MEYNTLRSKIHVKEYGRNIQVLIDNICQTDDAEERLEMANKTVNILKSVNTQYKMSENSDQKIWDMMHYISDFKLNVEGPYPLPPKDNFDFKPKQLKYSSRKGKRGYHLGKNLVSLVNIAKQTEQEEQKAYIVKLIAHYIRIAYFSWHKELPNDKFIQNEIHQLSEGTLDYDLSSAPKTAHYAQLNEEKKTYNPKGHKKQNHYNRKKRR